MFRALVLLAAIATLLAAAAALAPATLVGPFVERASNGFATLADAEGTVWQGHGTLGVRSAVRIPLAWRLDPWPLLQGEARISLVPPASSADPPRAEIAASRGRIAVRALDATLPAEAAAALAPRTGARLAGDVRVTSPSLEWAPRSFGGGARVVWRDAQFAVPNESAMRLGTVTADFAAAGDRLAGTVTNEGGDFEVRGSASLSASGIPELALAMTPRGGDPARGRSLALSPRPDGTGWSVDYRVGTR